MSPRSLEAIEIGAGVSAAERLLGGGRGLGGRVGVLGVRVVGAAAIVVSGADDSVAAASRDQRAVEVHGEPHVAGPLAGRVAGSGVAAVRVQRELAGDELQAAVVALGRREDAGVEAGPDRPVVVDDDGRPGVGARAVARRDGVDVVDEAVQREAVGARHHLAEVGLADLGGELGRLGGRRRRRRRRRSLQVQRPPRAGSRRQRPHRRRRRVRRRRARRATGSRARQGTAWSS